MNGTILIKAAVIALAAQAMAAGPAVAQERYPSRPIEFIVPFGPGGGADQLARKMASLLEPELKVSLPVVNVVGATGVTGLTKMLAAANDGYSISVFIADTFAQLATASPRWSEKDYIPLGIMVRQPSALFVKADSPFKTWADVVKEAKAQPGKLKVSILGFGSVDDMALRFMEGKGVSFNGVPFATPGERYASVLGGHADLIYEQPGDVKSMLDSKQIRPILLFNPERVTPEFANIESSREVGLEIYLPQFRSVIVKAGTDPQRVKVLADAVEKISKSPEFVSFLNDSIALRDSFIPAGKAQAFLDGELASMKQFAAALKKQ
jgi:tripartite-type tricarboxylate transporter receptor subunit TctC